MKPLAHIFSRGDNKYCPFVETIFGVGPGHSLTGIIWLRAPTHDERMALLPCLDKGGFELIAEPYVKDEESFASSI